MDRIFIKNLAIQTIIGIHDYERQKAQRVILDLEMSADIDAAAKHEHIDKALNYQTIAEVLTDYVQNSHFQLVETLAVEIVKVVQREFGVKGVRLTLHKPDALPGDTDVGVMIERGQLAVSAPMTTDINIRDH